LTLEKHRQHGVQDITMTKKNKKILYRTKKMSNTNPHLNPGVNPDVRQVSCSSLF
jgi:hypothetical protein